MHVQPEEEEMSYKIHLTYFLKRVSIRAPYLDLGHQVLSLWEA